MNPNGSEFIDYYELMQISPNAELETVQRVYRMLAARYHPDNIQTGDTAKFVLINHAYETLSNPETRSEYDVLYQNQRNQPLDIFELKEFTVGIDGEANRRMGILCLLYNRRRTNPDHAGLSLLEFEALMAMPREHLMFTLWYLREKNCIRQDEQSNYMITGDGIDYVEKNLRSHDVLYKLIKAAESGSSHTAKFYQDSAEAAGAKGS